MANWVLRIATAVALLWPLAAINGFIDDARASGFLQGAVAKSGIIGLEVAPPGYRLER